MMKTMFSWSALFHVVLMFTVYQGQTSTGSQVPSFKKCTALSNPTNGHVSLTYVNTEGEDVSFGCDSGYTLVGYRTATCSSGEWSTAPPTCELANGVIVGIIVGAGAAALVIIIIPVVCIVRKRRGITETPPSNNASVPSLPTDVNHPSVPESINLPILPSVPSRGNLPKVPSAPPLPAEFAEYYESIER